MDISTPVSCFPLLFVVRGMELKNKNKKKKKDRSIYYEEVNIFNFTSFTSFFIRTLFANASRRILVVDIRDGGIITSTIHHLFTYCYVNIKLRIFRCKTCHIFAETIKLIALMVNNSYRHFSNYYIT